LRGVEIEAKRKQGVAEILFINVELFQSATNCNVI